MNDGQPIDLSKDEYWDLIESTLENEIMRYDGQELSSAPYFDISSEEQYLETYFASEESTFVEINKALLEFVNKQKWPRLSDNAAFWLQHRMANALTLVRVLRHAEFVLCPPALEMISWLLTDGWTYSMRPAFQRESRAFWSGFQAGKASSQSDQ